MMTAPTTTDPPTRNAWQAAVLYGILDTGYLPPEQFVVAARELIAGGAGILQIRAKRETAPEIEALARAVNPVTQAAGVPLIINDFAEIAAAVGCAGVHVGQEDAAIERARAIMGPNTIVGKSTHGLTQAVAAASEGADYIGFGPLFATPTKPGRPAIGLTEIEKVHRLVPVPIFCIGGITLDRLTDVQTAGAQRVVIVSEMLGAPDRTAYARSVRGVLATAPREK